MAVGMVIFALLMGMLNSIANSSWIIGIVVPLGCLVGNIAVAVAGLVEQSLSGWLAWLLGLLAGALVLILGTTLVIFVGWGGNGD